MDDCWRWSADQHAQVAADLLDGNFVPTSSEDGWDGRPAHRHYSVYDSRDQEPGEQDYAPLLAGLIHLGLAFYKRDDISPGQPGVSS